jgi:hypothetical protein
MPGTIQNFFASIDPISPPSETHLMRCVRGGGAGYCPRVYPQSVLSFSAIVLRPDEPICRTRPGPAKFAVGFAKLATFHRVGAVSEPAATLAYVPQLASKAAITSS